MWSIESYGLYKLIKKFLERVLHINPVVLLADGFRGHFDESGIGDFPRQHFAEFERVNLILAVHDHERGHRNIFPLGAFVLREVSWNTLQLRDCLLRARMGK